MTLGQLCEQWLKMQKAFGEYGKRSPSSIEQYQHIYERYFSERIRRKDAGMADEAEMQRIWNQICEESGLPSNGTTMKAVRNFLHAVMDNGPCRNRTGRNIASAVQRRRTVCQPTVLLGIEDMRVLDEMSGEEAVLIWQTVLYTGLETGVIMGLQRGDLDTEKKTLHVCREIGWSDMNPEKEGNRRQGMIDLSGRSRERIVCIPPGFYEEKLAPYLHLWAEWVAAWGGKAEEGFLFCEKEMPGKPMRRSVFYRQSRVIREKLGKPDITLRSVRRTAEWIGREWIGCDELLFMRYYGTGTPDFSRAR